jgi:hypothetical protein
VVERGDGGCRRNHSIIIIIIIIIMVNHQHHTQNLHSASPKNSLQNADLEG